MTKLIQINILESIYLDEINISILLKIEETKIKFSRGGQKLSVSTTYRSLFIETQISISMF